jgi:hypothetical protein
VRLALIFFTASAEYFPNIKNVAMAIPPFEIFFYPPFKDREDF